MSDILLEHTEDGGEITVENGRFVFDDSPATAAYLSLFGGNERDAGTTATAAQQWWGNLLETEQARTYRSETQHLLRSLVATTSNLRRIEDAVKRDLAWMEDELGADVDASASMPALNKVAIEGSIVIDGAETPFNFLMPWRSE